MTPLERLPRNLEPILPLEVLEHIVNRLPTRSQEARPAHIAPPWICPRSKALVCRAGGEERGVESLLREGRGAGVFVAGHEVDGEGGAEGGEEGVESVGRF